MIKYKRNFYTGFFLLLFIPAVLFINFFVLKSLYPKDLPDTKLVNDYKHVEKLKRISDYCQQGHPGAMLVLARYYQREKLFDAEQCWLFRAVKRTKSPLAMLLLAQKFTQCKNKPLASFWYSQAVKYDPRIKSSRFKQAFEKELRTRLGELYEK